jgi:hypothetical protein
LFTLLLQKLIVPVLVGSQEDNMFRFVSRVGLLLGAAILALFIGAKLTQLFDPYRIVTEELVHNVAVEPTRTVRLNEYGTLASELRRTLHTEQAVSLSTQLDSPIVSGLLGLASIRPDVGIVVNGLEMTVDQIAALDVMLASVTNAGALSHNLAQLHDYDLDRGDQVLAELYLQSTAVSRRLSDVSEGVTGAATAVSAVTNVLELDKLPQTMAKANNAPDSILSKSLQSWAGLPNNLRFIQRKIEVDVAWLDNFEQQYVQAKAFNDRWHFNTLRLLPRFVAVNYQPLLLGVIGSLLLALAGWVGSQKPQRASQSQIPPAETYAPQPVRPSPSLAFLWPDGCRECQPLPQTGEVTIGNIVIRRARVRYYLERLDNAFPALLNGQSIYGARILNDGDVLQIGELQTTFEIAA